MKILGVDFGDRRIGIAIADYDVGIAIPTKSINGSSLMTSIQEILTIARNEKASDIVVGLPVSLDGNIHQQGKTVEDFCELLKQHTEIRIHAVDERYSSAEARSFLIASGMSPSRNRDQLNAAAAAVILQRWLDNHRHQST